MHIYAYIGGDAVNYEVRLALNQNMKECTDDENKPNILNFRFSRCAMLQEQYINIGNIIKIKH